MAVPRFKVTYSDGKEAIARCGPKAIVAFERQYDCSIEDVSKSEHIFYLAWQGLSVEGLELSHFDDFLGAIDAVDALEEGPLVPTPPGPPTET